MPRGRPPKKKVAVEDPSPRRLPGRKARTQAAVLEESSSDDALSEAEALFNEEEAEGFFDEEEVSEEELDELIHDGRSPGRDGGRVRRVAESDEDEPMSEDYPSSAAEEELAAPEATPLVPKIRLRNISTPTELAKRAIDDESSSTVTMDDLPSTNEMDRTEKEARKEEAKRKRKLLQEKKDEEEKRSTIQKLLTRQAKTVKRAPVVEEVEGEARQKTRKDEHVGYRLVQNANGTFLHLPLALKDHPLFPSSSAPPSGFFLSLSWDTLELKQKCV